MACASGKRIWVQFFFSPFTTLFIAPKCILPPVCFTVLLLLFLGSLWEGAQPVRPCLFKQQQQQHVSLGTRCDEQAKHRMAHKCNPSHAVEPFSGKTLDNLRAVTTACPYHCSKKKNLCEMKSNRPQRSVRSYTYNDRTVGVRVIVHRYTTFWVSAPTVHFDVFGPILEIFEKYGELTARQPRRCLYK